jgi:hypothetical protein
MEIAILYPEIFITDNPKFNKAHNNNNPLKTTFSLNK